MVDNLFRSRVAAVFLLAAVPLLSACGDDGDETGETSASAGQKPTVVMGSGDIQGTVDRFRDLLGPDNGGAPGGDPNGTIANSPGQGS